MMSTDLKTGFFLLNERVVDYHLVVYNRWGELIFESFDIKTEWDGCYRGELCQQDVYVWKVKVSYADGAEEIKAGDLTLIR